MLGERLSGLARVWCVGSEDSVGYLRVYVIGVVEFSFYFLHKAQVHRRAPDEAFTGIPAE